MNIFGNGVDIIKNERIKKSIKNINFLNRIYTKNEILLSKKKKNKINFLDIEILNTKKGKPFINLSKKLASFIKKKFKIKKIKTFLSLSDEKEYSIAYVILYKIK